MYHHKRWKQQSKYVRQPVCHCHNRFSLPDKNNTILSNSHLPYLNSVIRTLPQQPNEQFCSATSIFATLVCSFHICQKKTKRKVFPLQYQFCHSYCVKASKQLLFILGELCFQLHFVLSSCSAISNNTSSVISREKAKKKGSFTLYSFPRKLRLERENWRVFRGLLQSTF